MKSHPVAILLGCALAATVASAAVNPMIREDAALAVTLTKITEMRQLVVVEPEEDAFNFSQDKPGLHLQFTLAVPDGMKVLEVRQPERIIARDSKGTDLSQIEEDFSGNQTWAEMAMSFDDDGPREFTFHLATPVRDATHFSVQSRFDAIVYSGEVTQTMKLGSDWTQADPSLFGDQPVKMRFGKAKGFFGDSFGVTITPTTAREFIETITITVGGEMYESQMSSWDDSEITYMFEGDFSDNSAADVTLTLRTDLQTLPVSINIQKQPLP